MITTFYFIAFSFAKLYDIVAVRLILSLIATISLRHTGDTI